MKHCRKSVGLLVAVCALMPAGCASQQGRFAKKQQVNTAQLLAAARQYEKEGQGENAAHIYEHVLKYHPTNMEAKHGLALVRQGKLRVEYDTHQLLASTDPTVRKNPQARELLAKHQKIKQEQVTERMAQLIADAAVDPQKVEIDPSPTPAMVASLSRQPVVSAVVASKTVTAAPSADTPELARELIIHGAITSSQTPDAVTPAIAQADAVADQQSSGAIETTAFSNSNAAAEPQQQMPADWAADSDWKPHSLAHLCPDASDELLAEVRKLDSQADDVRKEGLTNLAQLGADAASAGPAVRRLLSDKNQLVAAHASWAVWEVEGDSSAAVESLVELLDSPSRDVIQFAAYTLSNIGPQAESAAAKLHELLVHEEAATRLHAAEALIHVAGPKQCDEAVDTLIVLLKDDDWEIRNLSAMMLGVADAENAEIAVASLLSALDDEDDRVRSAAALSLGAYGSKADFAVEKLQEVAQQDHTDVREAAQTALSCIKL